MPKISQFFKLQTIFRDEKNMIHNAVLKNLRKGQATVEYILLLVVLVFIVIGLKETFFKPFNNEFMPSYKDYYVCFMEKAALPGIEGCLDRPSWDPTLHNWPASSGSSSSWSGSGGNTWSRSGGNTWSRSGGNTWSGSGGSSWSRSGGGGTWGGGGNSSWESGANNRSPWGEYSNSNNNSTGVSKTPKDSFPVSGGKNNNLNSSYNNQFLVQSSSEGLDDLDDKRKRKQNRKKFKVKRKKGDTSTLTSANGNRSNRRSSQGDRFLMSGGAYDFEANEGENRGTAIAVPTEKSNKKNKSERKASFVVDAKSKQQAKIEEEDPITFGKFLKYIFIGLLILGILFFIGSQLMQVNENLKAS